MASRFDLLPVGGVRPTFSGEVPRVSGWYFCVGRSDGCQGFWCFVSVVAGSASRCWGEWLDLDGAGCGPWPLLSLCGRVGVPLDLVVCQCRVLAWAGPFVLRGALPVVRRSHEGGPPVGVAPVWALEGPAAVCKGVAGELAAPRSAGWWRVYVESVRRFCWVYCLRPGDGTAAGGGRFEFESWRPESCVVGSLAACALRSGAGCGWGPIVLAVS